MWRFFETKPDVVNSDASPHDSCVRLVLRRSDPSPAEGGIESRDPAVATGIELPELLPLIIRPPLRPSTTLRLPWSSLSRAKSSKWVVLLLSSGINSHIAPLEYTTCPLLDSPLVMDIGVSIPAPTPTADQSRTLSYCCSPVSLNENGLPLHARELPSAWKKLQGFPL